MKIKKNHFLGFLFTLTLFSSPALLRAETPPDLDAYLGSHPAISEAIIWEFPVVQQSKVINPEETSDEGSSFKLWNIFLDSYSTRLLSYDRELTIDPDRVILSPRDEFQDTQIDPELYKKLKIDFSKFDFPQGSPTPEPLPQDPPPQNPKIGLAQNWALFPETQKQKIRDDFASMWVWVETCWPKYQEFRDTDVKPEGFDVCFSTAEPANYPPANLQWMEPLPNGYSNWTVISSDDAFDLYSKMVALSLVLEIKGILPWTLGELSADSLKEIFDGTKWFRFVSPGSSEFGIIVNEGYLVLTTVLPAPATMTFSFLAQRKLILGSKMETLVKFLEWERDNMAHTSGGQIMDDCPWKNGGLYWGYKGRAPLSRILNGTVMGCPMYYSNGQGGWIENFDPTVRHWIGGCGGAAGFNQQVLRVINFPAEMTRYSHAQNNFLVDNNVRVWMGHADDSYGQKYSRFNGGEPEIPIAEILIDDATFKSWVVDYDYNDPNLTQAQKDAYAAQNTKANSQRSIDLMLKYMPKNMILWHCWWDQGKSHDQTYLFNSYFKLVYQLPELESMYIDQWSTNVPGVWQNIEAKVTALGGCDQPWLW